MLEAMLEAMLEGGCTVPAQPVLRVTAHSGSRSTGETYSDYRPEPVLKLRYAHAADQYEFIINIRRGEYR